MTRFYKFVLPAIWIGGFVLGTAALFVKDFSSDAVQADAPPPAIKWLFLVVTIIGGTFLYRTCVMLKRVTMSDGDLAISNFRHEIVVPLADVQHVTENRWLNIHPVTLHLRHDTPFGRRVVFIPQLRLLSFMSSHPIVRQLLEASANAAQLGGSGERSG